MKLRQVLHESCPAGIVAIAINNNVAEQHCGLIYTDSAGGIVLCDMQWENILAVRPLPMNYFWVEVLMQPHEVALVSAVVDMISSQHPGGVLIPYSTIYNQDGFDFGGRIKSGSGVTCATFVMNVFERLSLDIVDASSWKARQEQDDAFRERIAKTAESFGQAQVAARIRSEKTAFRVKPYELCGSASHTRYPVKFVQGKKLAKGAAKLVRKSNKGLGRLAFRRDR